MKLLEENIGSTLLDIYHSKNLYDPPPREMEIKTKKLTNKQQQKNKWDLIKLKSFCTTKETINEMRRQPQNRRK